MPFRQFQPQGMYAYMHGSSEQNTDVALIHYVMQVDAILSSLV